MRVKWKHLGIAAAVLPFAAVFGAWLGVFNVGAASGHWKITDWFLHFAMQSSVRTYALPVEAPQQLPSEGIQPAAGHFERGCAICHGSPAAERSPAVMEMLPHPPDLAGVLGGDKWTDEQLFRIVKKGVRFTGMPAWPTQDRDDEVWEMVAFLRSYPDLDAEEYRDLAFGPAAEEAEVAPGTTELDAAIAECGRCHGEDGMGRSPAVPVIAGQRETYLRESLEAYAEGDRASGIMQQAAVQMDDVLIEELAAHYAALPWRPVREEGGTADPELRALGEKIAREGIVSRDIPACSRCHDRPDRNPVYPSLDGQKASYIAAQLRLFAAEKRGGTRFHELMEEFAHRLEETEIQAAAAYFSSLPPAAGETIANQ